MTHEILSDPIVEEIHQIRASLIQQYGDDLHAFCEAIRLAQGKSGNEIVTRSPRLAREDAHALPMS